MHIFHRWEYLYKKDIKSFLGEDYVYDRSVEIRICKVCNKAQKGLWSMSGNYWMTLNSQELLILGKNIISNSVYKLKNGNKVEPNEEK